MSCDQWRDFFFANKVPFERNIAQTKNMYMIALAAKILLAFKFKGG